MLFISSTILWIASIVRRYITFFDRFHLLILKLHMSCLIHIDSLISNLRLWILLVIKTRIHCSVFRSCSWSLNQSIISHDLRCLCFLLSDSTRLSCSLWYEELISRVSLLHTVILNVNFILIAIMNVLRHKCSLAWSDRIFVIFVDDSFPRSDLDCLLLISIEHRHFINVEIIHQTLWWCKELCFGVRIDNSTALLFVNPAKILNFFTCRILVTRDK